MLFNRAIRQGLSTVGVSLASAARDLSWAFSLINYRPEAGRKTRRDPHRRVVRSQPTPSGYSRKTHSQIRAETRELAGQGLAARRASISA